MDCAKNCQFKAVLEKPGLWENFCSFCTELSTAFVEKTQARAGLLGGLFTAGRGLRCPRACGTVLEGWFQECCNAG